MGLGYFFKLRCGCFFAFAFGLEGFFGSVGAGVFADLGFVGFECFAEGLGRGFVAAFLHVEEKEHAERDQDHGDESRKDLMAVVVNPVEALGADLDKLVWLFEFFAARFAATFGFVCCLDHEGLPWISFRAYLHIQKRQQYKPSHVTRGGCLCVGAKVCLYMQAKPSRQCRNHISAFYPSFARMAVVCVMGWAEKQEAREERLLISCVSKGGSLRSARSENRTVGGLSKERTLEKRRYLLTGGGTGGHVYPAIAIADELRRREPEAAFLYVGVKGKAEEKIAPKRGYEIRFVSSEGWPGGRPSLALLRFAWRLGVGVLQAILILRRYQPHVIIATGGYVSAPIMLAWVLLRRLKLTQARAFVHEQNLMPGRLNLLIGKLADRTGVSFEESRRYLPQAEFVGYPVRKEIVGTTQAEARERLKLPADARVVLAFGGSQGARTINRALIDALPRLLQDPKIWVIHGVGRLDSPLYRAEQDTHARFSALTLSEEQRKRYQTYAYLDPIEDYYAAADLVVGRGGAGTLTEMAVCGLASLIIPKANLPGDHQVRNARALQDGAAADVVYEHAQRTEEGLIDVVSGDELAVAIERLLQDPERLAKMRSAIRSFGDVTALGRIVDRVQDLAAGRLLALPDRPTPKSDGPVFTEMSGAGLVAHLSRHGLKDIPPREIEYLTYRADGYLSSEAWQTRNNGVKLVGLLKLTRSSRSRSCLSCRIGTPASRWQRFWAEIFVRLGLFVGTLSKSCVS